MAPKIAFAGATGNLGPAILKALLDADFEVIVLSRKDSNTTDNLPKHVNQHVVKVDYTHQQELIAALQVEKHLEELAAADPDFTYTLVYNNVFFDWGLEVGFILNPKKHKGTLYDGGDVPFSTTRLSTIGKAVVGIIENQEATKNRAVFIHDAVVTQKRLIQLYESIDGKECETEVKSTSDIAKGAWEEFKTPTPTWEVS
ncbi:hypothetical protein LTS08_005648 [Lithohypha guttulata]|uniref:uncharacterized protein n=1 Tax=Lithohypha guttulata TaxID=1690604 RepID=UPI002DDED9D6|nr:hypothetical protein LTR51_003182 [Lithohypha guttulata]KAK5099933.1 hypothetical protein LTS08_005648 [Lithohypha guttulata]